MSAGGWQETIGTTLHGKTIGILGLGKLGSRVAAVAQAFGMQPIAWSQNLTAERAAAAGARLVAKDELFAEADIVTIHLVLGERTRGLVGARELGLMKPTAILINTSRGPIVDETALIAALQAGTIRAAGLDVYDREPLPRDHPLRSLRQCRAHAASRLRDRGRVSGVLSRHGREHPRLAGRRTPCGCSPSRESAPPTG